VTAPAVFLLLASLPSSFANSGSPAAQPAFQRGVVALHNFQYEDAVEAFQEAQRRDPGFALAYWGEAMAFNQTLWLNQDVEQARKILGRLGPTAEARAAKAKTEREKGLLAAVEALFGPGEREARDKAYAEAMGRLAAAHPDDPEVQTFHALALMGTTARSPALFQDGGDDKHQHALVGSDVQKQAAVILQKVLRKHPRHPGALHYLIHDYDDPEHARLALPAARAYAQVAAQSSHALHMPAHIFLQLGLWDEAAASDEASFRASEAWVARKGLGLGMRDHHSLSWLLYESLQRGRYQRAKETLALIRPAVAETGAARLKALQSDMRARFVVETRAYQETAGVRDFGTSSELFAIGLSAARRGDAGLAQMALGELGRRARPAAGAGAPGTRLDLAVMEKELEAVMAVVAGDATRAASSLREAVALERQLPPPLGPPRPIKPASELAGELLLELKRPSEAVVELERALRGWPNRSLTLLGLARAQAALGDREAARRHAQALLRNWRSADPNLPELPEVRALAGEPAPR
jgi:tetratricopeptide (TPR) repeat protein